MNHEERNPIEKGGVKIKSRNALLLIVFTILLLLSIAFLAGYRPFGSGGKCEGDCTVTLTTHDVPLNYEVSDFVDTYLYNENGEFRTGGVISVEITEEFKESLRDFVNGNRVLRVTRNCTGPKCTCDFDADDEDILQRDLVDREIKYTVRIPFEDGSYVIREYTITVDAVIQVFNGTCIDTPLVPQVEVIPNPGG